jgi:hypothetical protein
MSDKPKTIYPEVDVQFNNGSIKLWTTLRKEHNGKWYFWDFFRRADYPVVGCKEIADELGRFHIEVYRVIMGGIVDTTAVMLNGEKVFEEDHSAVTEDERLDGKYKPAIFSTDNLDLLKKMYP